MEVFRPEMNYELKAEIIRAGYSSISSFANEIGTSVSLMSQILHRWRLPGPTVQKKIAKALGIKITELRDLLTQ